MTNTPPAKNQSQSSADAGERTVEVRVLLPGALVRRMDINRALVGQTRQAFLQLALQRHLELYSHLILDLSPEGKGGVGVQIAGKDEPRRALPRRSVAEPDPDPSGTGGGARRTPRARPLAGSLRTGAAGARDGPAVGCGLSSRRFFSDRPRAVRFIQ